MIAPSESNTNSYGAERRDCGRQRVLFSSVVLNEGNCGRVLNISPNGLALQTDTELAGEEFPFRFKFSPSLAWVEAKGRVVWRNDAKNVVGIEFIGLTDEVQRQIRTWMDWKKDSTEPLGTNLPSANAPLNEGAETNEPIAAHEDFLGPGCGREWSAAPAPTSAKPESENVSAERQKPASQTPEFLFPPSSVAEFEPENQGAADVSPENYDFASRGATPPKMEDQNLPSVMTAVRDPVEIQEFAEPGERKFTGGIGTQIKIIGLALLILFMIGVILVRRNHSQAPSKGIQSREVVKTPRQPARSEQATPTPPNPPAKSPNAVSPVASPAVSRASVSNENPTAHGPAFVLQVAAMLHEENANALKTTLRDSNFPAFVTKLPAERFHHVLVGPFNSASAAMETQTRLEQRGYKPIRMEWKASSR
jgi:cell division septation protein DedD